MKVATNLDDMILKTTNAAREVMNRPAGQALTEKIFQAVKAQKPDLTEGEWEQMKADLLTFLGLMTLGGAQDYSGHYMACGEFTGERSDLSYEASAHLWAAMRDN